MGDGKRKRAAAFSEHERYMHKSSVLLQREGKKIRTFLVRKVLVQLKQTREQLVAATANVGAADANTDDKKLKRLQGKEKKLAHQLQRLEREHAALKTLDLQAVVATAFERTGLKPNDKEEEEEDDDDSEDDGGDHIQQRSGVVEDEDDGFNSEDYDEGPRPLASESESSDSEEEEEEESGDDNDEEDAEKDHPEEQEKEERVEATSTADDQVRTVVDADKSPVDVAQLVERVLSHNQMKPFLNAIANYVEKKQRDDAKKKRQREKAAIKKARASLVGGRSASAPTSMFFGSLAGGADADDFNAPTFDRSQLAGADDDIAAFLGETKKKKNRPGQMARRQKAMRMEEAQEHGGGGDGFAKRRFNDRDQHTMSKYGPSERPKKPQKTTTDRSNRSGGPRNDRHDRQASGQRPDRHREPRCEQAPPPPPTTPKPAARPPPPPVQRKPEAAPSHPSWVAKQALKDKEKVSIHAFAGKKMTFDDGWTCACS